jgi:hypothetical protein
VTVSRETLQILSSTRFYRNPTADLLNPSTAIMDAPGTNKDVVLSAKKAPAQDSARAAEIFARIYEIQRLEKQVENLTEKIMHLEEGSIWQQKTRSAASPENRNRNRR